MNRHARRAAAKAKTTSTSLMDLSGAAEKLQPFLSQLEGLKFELAKATELLRQAQSQNAVLNDVMTMQRAVYLRMFAQGMGVSLDTVVSMADKIQAELTQGKTDAIENPRTPSPDEVPHHSSP